MNYRDIFTTPVATASVDPSLCMNFLKCTDSAQASFRGALAIEGEAVSTVSEIIQSKAEQYAERNLGPGSVSITASWVNNHGFGDFNTPHHHGGSMFAACLYLLAPRDCGDLLLSDPRGAALWTRYQREVNTRGSVVDCRSYHRVSVSPGLLVFFPAYIIHQTEPNLSRQRRSVLAVNFSFKPQ